MTDAAHPAATARLARSTWNGAVASWRATPRGARKRYGTRLLVATAVAAGASAGSAVLLRGVAVDQLLPGDAALVERAEGLLDVHSAVWLGAFTSSAMIMPLLVLMAVLWARQGRWERAATSVAAYIASKAILLAGWNSWSRDRPADVAGGELVPAELASYPSGHSVQMLTVYGLLVYWWVTSSRSAWERVLAGVLLMVMALIIGWGRVRIGAHYPSDIFGGIVLGGIWLWGAAWAERAVKGDGVAS